MAQETGTEEVTVDAIPSRMPNWVAYVWLSLLEAVVGAGLILFAIVLIEGGDLIPDLPEFTIGTIVFLVLFGGGFLLKYRKG